MYLQIHIYIYIYTFIAILTYTYTYTYIHIYIYIYIYMIISFTFIIPSSPPLEACVEAGSCGPLPFATQDAPPNSKADRGSTSAPKGTRLGVLLVSELIIYVDYLYYYYVVSITITITMIIYYYCHYHKYCYVCYY